jgi:hypothetical protein
MRMGLGHWIYDTFFREGVERRRVEKVSADQHWRQIVQVLSEEGFRSYSNIGPLGHPAYWGGQNPWWFTNIEQKLASLGAQCSLACFSMVDNFPVLYVYYAKGLNTYSGTYKCNRGGLGGVV